MAEKPRHLAFEVSTHLFNELGRLLVGRESTALSELIKNAYDADATLVRVYGEKLADAAQGFIRVSDDGVGMTEEEFAHGFLRIASGLRRTADRRSSLYKRRFTGAKGIGRLAAHKLARVLEISSVSRKRDKGKLSTPRQIVASIDWDLIESHDLLEEAKDAIVLKSAEAPNKVSGTVLKLSKLRRAWTEARRVAFAFEALSLQPPEPLISPIKTSLVKSPLLFKVPQLRDTDNVDPGLRVELTGDFSTGDDYWSLFSDDATWVIEVEGNPKKLRVVVAPTKRTLGQFPLAKREEVSRASFSPHSPGFQARIFVREGRMSGQLKTFAERNGGVRVYMEGFRVLPYGDTKDDWLDIQSEYTKRTGTLSDDPAFPKSDRTAVLTVLPQERFTGAVFLTENKAPGLEMLVNREGFVDGDVFESLTKAVRWSIDVFFRARARTTETKREEARRARAGNLSASSSKMVGVTPASSSALSFESAASQLMEETRIAVQYARSTISTEGARAVPLALKRLDTQLTESFSAYRVDLSEYAALLRILATVGTQMASFVHEIRGLLGIITTVESGLTTLHSHLDTTGKPVLRDLQRTIADLRLNLERQVSYLVDVTSLDVRRRRSRQNVSDSFERARLILEKQALARKISIRNNIPSEIKTRAMFAAEIRTVMINLLSNAIRAAGKKGRILVTGGVKDGWLWVRMENTGRTVALGTSEKWFRPFESTSVDVETDLGQGMGLGLPITAATLEAYSGEIAFVRPRPGYSTSIMFKIPE